MADVSISVRMHPEVINRQVSTIGRRAVNETARDIEREAKRIVPVRTGATRESIKANPARTRGARGYIAASVSAGGASKFLMKGTRPHVIRARNAQALHFEWKGREVFFREVNHPGTAAQPFLTIAAERVAARNRATR